MIDEDFPSAMIGYPPAGWILDTGYNWGVEQEGDGRRYLTTPGSVESDESIGTAIQRWNDHANNDVSFSYRFAASSFDDQQLRVHARFLDGYERASLFIQPNRMTIVNSWIDEDPVPPELPEQESQTSIDFYSERDTWYKVFMRTIGSNMYVWVQREDEALPWEDAIRVQPPLLTNGSTPLGTMTSLFFRINLITHGYDTPGVVSIADIRVRAYTPCDILPDPPCDIELIAEPAELSFPDTPVIP